MHPTKFPYTGSLKNALRGLGRARFSIALFGAAGLLVSQSDVSEANSEATTLGVIVEVSTVCAIEGGVMDFGAYESGQTSTVPAVGAIAYSGCPQGVVNVALDAGNSGDEAQRSMTDNGGNALNYHLFQDTARTTFWGTGDASKTLEVDESGTGTWEVYGRIIREQFVPPGTYTDSINVILTF